MPELDLVLADSPQVVHTKAATSAQIPRTPLPPGTPGCEWDPDRLCAATPDSTHNKYCPAVHEVDVPGDGIWRLCWQCSARAPFKGLERRRMARRSRP